MRKLIAALAVAALLPGCGKEAPAAAVQSGGGPAFAVAAVPLPGEGRGDYVTVDRASNRLFVTHSTVVHILDLTTLRPIAEVRGLKTAHGVAIAGGHGFVTDEGHSAVVQFDPVSGRVERVILAGKKPDSIITDPATGRVWAMNNESATMTVIDSATGKVVRTLRLPDDPEVPQVDGRGMLWANMAPNRIAVIDSRAMTLLRTITLTGCEEPTPLAFDPAQRLLFSGCGNGVMTVTDPDAGRVIATVPLDKAGDPDGIAFDAARKRIVVANRNGGWTIIRQNARADYTVEPMLPIDPYAKTVALDPETHRLFSSTADLVWPPATPGKKHLPNARSGTFRLTVVSER